ncbi:MAG: DinB family protein [Chloroflexota bacterium]
MKPSAQEIVHMLQGTPAVLEAMLAHLDDKLLCWQPQPADWCIKEVLGHLIATDQLAFADRIWLIVEGNNPEIPAVPVNQIASERNDVARPIGDLLAEFRVGRTAVLPQLAHLTPDQLAKTGTYPSYGTFHAYDFLYEWPYHDHSHLQQISDILKAHVFPHMSQTMQQALGADKLEA